MKEEGREEDGEDGRMGICQVLKRERALEAFMQNLGHMNPGGKGTVEPC